MVAESGCGAGEHTARRFRIGSGRHRPVASPYRRLAGLLRLLLRWAPALPAAAVRDSYNVHQAVGNIALKIASWNVQ
ncbi:hypothetical protein CO641_12660 [Lysobacteraceae bacterium NML91-0213]|nr:hypothetical protein CO641_12660 [Xanthomonadaceae bacterium NML91-0213]